MAATVLWWLSTPFGLAQDKTICLPANSEIDAYLSRPEPDFLWDLAEVTSVEETRILRLNLTSQRWQGLVWKHALLVYEPKIITHPEHLLLFVTGGNNGQNPGAQELAMGASMARLCGARVAVLHQVPNQPLLNGRKEDDLITETWLKYIDTGDATWPLLFPMVKSAVKAMDALEQLGASRGWQPIKGFVISGASKRGWTSWLSAASDRRVVATAPIVIDMLNFSAQIKHQKEIWGTFSEQIVDYTSKGLIPEDGIPREGREAKIWEMMDPFNYRDKLTMPKLLIVGANDRYWATDAMSFYWGDLLGQKAIHRVPNGGHGLEGGREGALATLGVFFRHVVVGSELPKLVWNKTSDDRTLGLTVKCDRSPKQGRLWVVNSDTLDFRDCRWEPKDLVESQGRFEGNGGKKPMAHQAIFGELGFEHDGIPFKLATLVYCQ